MCTAIKNKILLTINLCFDNHFRISILRDVGREIIFFYHDNGYTIADSSTSIFKQLFFLCQLDIFAVQIVVDDSFSMNESVKTGAIFNTSQNEMARRSLEHVLSGVPKKGKIRQWNFADVLY